MVFLQNMKYLYNFSYINAVKMLHLFECLLQFIPKLHSALCEPTSLYFLKPYPTEIAWFSSGRFALYGINMAGMLAWSVQTRDEWAQVFVSAAGLSECGRHPLTKARPNKKGKESATTWNRRATISDSLLFLHFLEDFLESLVLSHHFQKSGFFLISKLSW
jgi:hypothetical protein